MATPKRNKDVDLNKEWVNRKTGEVWTIVNMKRKPVGYLKKQILMITLQNGRGLRKTIRHSDLTLGWDYNN